MEGLMAKGHNINLDGHGSRNLYKVEVTLGVTSGFKRAEKDKNGYFRTNYKIRQTGQNVPYDLNTQVCIELW